MEITKAFPGGNIRIIKEEKGIYFLDNELRDSTEDWFYWAFAVDGKKGEKAKFSFPDVRLGPFGPAVSYDLFEWGWLGKDGKNTFSYEFKEDGRVYFAHSMLYLPERFYAFSEKQNLEIKELCKTKKGRSVPVVTFGDGEEIILLTARHHACESTGSYVLEGVLERLISKNIPDFKVICIPFVDFDGVTDGDQGKGRAPYDHNRDYDIDKAAIYPETQAIREIAESKITYAFDFHSPWHMGGRNDKCFIVEKSHLIKDNAEAFSCLLEREISDDSFCYKAENNLSPDTEWNKSNTPCFATYMINKGAKMAFSLETAYFGEEGNAFSEKAGIALGRCFAETLMKFAK